MNKPVLIIQPLTAEQQQQVREHTRRYIKQAIDYFDLKEKTVEISFNIKGQTSGMYRVSRNLTRYKREIRYNPYIFSKFFEDSYETTVPHEVAHYITDIMFGLNNIKPHGKEWKAVMQVFGADAAVTSNYDLTGIPVKKQSLFTYQCSCREHKLSSIRHNKIKLRRYKYYCNTCKQCLTFKKR